jgi:hypothetical protein
MWFSKRIRLLRYLFACRLNSSQAVFSGYPAVELSLILGHAIADRLPAVQARQWRKALGDWKDRGAASLAQVNKNELPSMPWPIESVILFYPAKHIYGQGEIILWELKLFGDAADHNMFLEAILPSLEEIGYRLDPRWHYKNCLWGHFDIHSIYVAHGSQWEPLVENGQLNLRYQATPFQWAEGLNFNEPWKRPHDLLTWVTPFDLEKNKQREAPRRPAPSLRSILDGFVARVSVLLAGKFALPEHLWELLPEDQAQDLKKALEFSARIPVLQHEISNTPYFYPGDWQGQQTFSTTIPDVIRPYLTFAAIFHVGRHTHFGCGTFVLN